MDQVHYRTARTRAQDALIHARKAEDGTWTCCDITFDKAPGIYRHMATQHADIIELHTQQELDLIRSKKSRPAAEDSIQHGDEFKGRRAEKYGSDPISLHCSCDPALGTVILFYAYLPIDNPLALAQLHKTWSLDLNLCGKVKVATEGINTTLAGTSKSVHQYLDLLTTQPELAPLQLGRPTKPMSAEETAVFDKKRYDFFKPTPGCGHVFGSVISIKVVDEICPLGAPELSVYHDPSNKPGKLPPREFHNKLKDLEGREDVVVLDVRNYYESHLGHFPGAVKPPIRKFSSFRDYVDRNKDQFSGKTILSYCTGGIRCEKATSYLRKSLESEANGEQTEVLMLEGGIHNYLEWIKHEGKPKESLWLGRNYVFDARQSLGLEDPSRESSPNESIISYCQQCQVPSARYVKCRGFGCHRLIVACAVCSPTTPTEESGICCCDECLDMGNLLREYSQLEPAEQSSIPRVKRGICACERKRRTELGVE
ncbi:thiosulfate sulfurtransferase (rhodanese)-like domain-containing protein 2 [Mortierella antarctica]|nr:thiosulfate sulfurtransferase (rhodanese)-like domain-containing protein 2 [Mortierella antarctica]